MSDGVGCADGGNAGAAAQVTAGAARRMVAAMPSPHQIARAAAAYWAAVFAFAFVLGIGRTLWLTPQIGALAATACEVPLTLAASWWTARRLTAHYRIAGARAALAMGLAAFAILMLAEVSLAGALSGQSLGAWLRSLATPAGALGLAGQVLFGLMPWWVTRHRQHAAQGQHNGV